MKKIFNEHVIDVIEITDSVEVVFYYDYFNEKVWANIRKFIKSKKYTGPTNQGIKFDPAKLREIKEAFDTANDHADTIQDEEFLRIPRSPNRDLVVHASIYKGSLGVDLRVWLKTENYKGWTKQGYRFPINVVPAVIQAFEKMVQTKPDLKEITNQSRVNFDKPTASSEVKNTNASQKDIDGIPERLKHLFEKEKGSGK